MKTSYTNLDTLRSLAVLSVVAQHLWHQCVNFHLCAYNPATNQFLANLSFTGVMFFFVHTCLVLMLSMHRAPAEHLGRSFLIRRAFRIYPLCWITILLALATGFTDQPEANLHFLGWRGVAANLLLVQNLTRALPSIVGPLWSLPWEVQMYLLLPLFFVFLRRFGKLRFVFAVWTGSAVLSILATQPGLPRAFHAAVFPPMFIAGMVAYKLLLRQSDRQRPTQLPGWAWPLLVAGLFALQNCLAGEHDFESPIGAGINSCICLALALAIPAFTELRQGWMVRPAQEIAKYSYGVYLLHVPALIFVMRYLPALPLPLKIAAFLALTTLLSAACFQAIENPLIQLGKQLTQPRQRFRARFDAVLPGSAAARGPGSAAPVEVSRAEPKACRQKGGAMPVRLSVLMSMYEKESPACLCECLDSLAMQTLRADEVVLVEDGPLGDALKDTIDRYRKILPIVSLPLPAHVGLGAALRSGLHHCQGEYVARMDSDDICVPERFEKQMKFLESNPEVDVVGAAIAEFEEDPSAPHSIRMLPEAGAALRHFARFRTPMNHVTVTFRKASVLAAGNYRASYCLQDYYLWARMLALGYVLHNLSEVLVYVRCGNGMQARRGGFAYAKEEIHLQGYLRELGLLNAPGALLNIVMRVPVRLAPSFVRAFCYRLILRNRPRDLAADSGKMNQKKLSMAAGT